MYIVNNNNNKISAIVRIRMKNALWRPLLRTSSNLRFSSYFVIYVYVTWQRAHQRFWRTDQKTKNETWLTSWFRRKKSEVTGNSKKWSEIYKNGFQVISEKSLKWTGFILHYFFPSHAKLKKIQNGDHQISIERNSNF